MYLARQAAAFPFDIPPVSNDSHGKIIMGITGGFTAFACTAVILRIYVRIFMLKMMGPDDYVMLIAMACSVAVFVFLVTEVNLGVGEHWGNMHMLMNYQEIIHWSYHHAWLMVIGISSVKLSVGLFLLRLVQGKWYKRCILGWIAFLIAFTFACVCTLIFQCLPVEAAYSFELKADPKTRCYSLSVFRSIGLFNGAINLFTDFVFASLPIPIIIPLQINRRTKISLICILSLGYFACAASIVKEYLLSRFFENIDNLFNDAFNTWSDVELNTGILAACLPTLRPLFASLLKNASTLKYTDTRSHTAVVGPRNCYLVQDHEELISMPSNSTFSNKKDEHYGVRIIGGSSPFDDERRMYRQDSVASSGPTSRLEKDIEENESGSDHHRVPGLQRLNETYVKKGRDRKDWRDQRVGKTVGGGF